MAQIFLLAASISGALAVCLGAFAAHGLKARLSAELLSAFRTGVDYQFYHTFALLAVALLLKHIGLSALLNTAGWLFLLGILLFSGSLYAMALGGPKWLGPVTPLGGLCFIVGWACMAWAAATNNTF
jgi:uncharacterized membrane protein YgdD (TMEM256/DUF423 family)